MYMTHTVFHKRREYCCTYPFNAQSVRQEYPKIVWGFDVECGTLEVDVFVMSLPGQNVLSKKPVLSFSVNHNPEMGKIEQAVAAMSEIEIKEYEIVLKYIDEINARIYRNHIKRKISEIIS